MIIRIRPRQEGIVEYLKTGKRPDSNLSRNEKDLVVSIDGDLDFVDKTIKQAQATKKWNDYYQHITIGFTNEDFDKFYDPRYDAWDLDKLQSLVSDFMNLYLAGYDNREYTYYAELHYPKIKINEQGKERLPHIHIVLPIMNLIANTKLLPTKWSIKNNDLIQTYLAKKYDLDLPIYHKREDKKPQIVSKAGLKRKELAELLKDIKTEQELLDFFKQNNLQYRKVSTKKNTYYKVVNPAGKDVNLRGRGLEHIEQIAKFGYVKDLQPKKQSIAERHAQMSLSELEEEIKEYINRRVQEIGQRRSKKATERLLNTENDVKEENCISTTRDIKKTFQEQLLEKIYNRYIPLNAKGFYVKKERDRVKVVNRSKDINIEDRGNKIVAKGKNYKEQIKLMLDMAEAKGWKLEEIVVSGSEEFKKEAYRQIKERIKQRELQQQKTPTPQNYIFKPQPTQRPTNYTEQAHKEKEEAKKLDKELIKEIKTNLDPYRVLEYVAKRYKIDLSKYEVIGNKINNKTNRQKPKNVIDFLQKEVGLSISEAFSVADKLYQEQIKTQQKQPIRKDFAVKLSYNTYTKIDYPVKNWKTKELKNKTELETLIKNYPYSPFVFESGYRSSNNTRELTALILDFDNDNKDYIISMEQVLNKLKQAGIKALAVETKSSGKEKNGIVAERFRVIIPITEHIKITKENREEYARATELFIRELGLYDYLDKGALRDIARMYRPSPLGAKATAINGKAVDFNEYMEQAKKVILKEKEEQERQRQERLKRLQNIEDNISAYTYTADTTELAGLTYADTSKILSIPFESLIGYFENIEKEYKEGKYKMIKTDTAKYSVLKNGEVMHDFKSGKTYNKISYLYEKLNVNNLMSLARALQQITGEEYIKVNENLVKDAIKEATEQATDLYEFNDIIKRECNVEFCRVDIKNNIIKIADIEFQADTKAILDKINENKAEKQRQKQKQRSQGRGMGI